MTTDAIPAGLKARLAELDHLEAQLDAQLDEALRALPQLQEPGWRELGRGSNSELIASEIDRATQNQLARWYAHQDPTASQAVMLHNAYTFARGVSVKAKDERVQRVIDAFWQDPRNRHSLTRAAAQWRLNTERQLEGELFLALFVSTLTGRVTVRLFDPAEFPEHNGVVTLPGDPTFPVYFRREYTPRWYDFEAGAYKTGERRVAYYPDYRNAAVGVPGGHGKWVQWERGTEVYVMHVCTNPLGGRGLTHLNPGIPWVKALKGFAEDRVTLTAALATFAFKQKVRGNRVALQKLIDQWGRYETEKRYGPPGDSRERRQAANTLIENEASTLEQLKTDSGSSNAYLDMRMLRQMAGLGLGHIFEHYLGDPSTGNLATATAMELPMLKLFEFEQQVWEDVIGDLVTFVVLQGLRFGPREVRALGRVAVDRAGGSPLWVVKPKGDVDLTVTASLPPIVQSDVAVWANALSSIAQAEVMTGQQIVPPEQKAITALHVLGVDDVGTIVDDLKANRFEIAAVPRTDGQTPEDAVEARLVAAVRERYRARKAALVQDYTSDSPGQQLRAADAGDEPPRDVGKKPPKADVEHVEPITREEVEDYFDWFARMPALEDLLDEMGLTLDDVDES